MGLAAVQYVGSSQTRDQTHVFCIGRWVLYHWATREALPKLFAEQKISNLWFKDFLSLLIITANFKQICLHGLTIDIDLEMKLNIKMYFY